MQCCSPACLRICTFTYASLLLLPKPAAGELGLEARHCTPKPLLRLRAFQLSFPLCRPLEDFPDVVMSVMTRARPSWDACSYVPSKPEHGGIKGF